MPVLISLGNGFLKLVDDGRPGDDPGQYRIVDVKQAPPQVKQEIEAEMHQVAQSMEQKPGKSPYKNDAERQQADQEAQRMELMQEGRQKSPALMERLYAAGTEQKFPTMGDMAASTQAPNPMGPQEPYDMQRERMKAMGKVQTEDGEWVDPGFYGPPPPRELGDGLPWNELPQSPHMAPTNRLGDIDARDQFRPGLKNYEQIPGAPNMWDRQLEQEGQMGMGPMGDLPPGYMRRGYG